MANSPIIQSTLSVVSGQLCFGSLHNIWFGSSAPSQGLPVAPPHQVAQLKLTASTTTLPHKKEYGTPSNLQEVDKILRISVSPYEPDHGSTINNDVTSQAGVFVVNRYDWGYYDKRCFDEIGEGQEEDDDDVLANSNSLGLVDRSIVQEMVQ
ncbi:hypothetical protein FOQG_11551 [Fusarium oxysporum f. sp. raphani 54005]|uniref:Uncharacterized protein n=1 Tax=Fusarium oxysporum f. sp. raphani 54005 TaxID=1089458 RepID=X0CP38_FUSOX|nr:hypothetical protein FOQG_11551 [Fusarium oxysporum f. sp. raphani 54005]